jgi:dGTPase
LVGFSVEMREASTQMKRFLYRELYRHPQVMATTDTAKQVVADLFTLYRDRPGELPAENAGTAGPVRSLADYIAGMTDRFAIREHTRLTGARIFGD